MNQILPRVCKSKNCWITSDFFKGLQEFLPGYQGTSVSGWIISRRQVQALIWLKYSVWDTVELSAVWLKFLVLNHKQFLLYCLIPKGLLQQWTLSKWAHYQSVHSINTRSASRAWTEGSESKLNKELQCSWNSACNHIHVLDWSLALLQFQIWNCGFWTAGDERNVHFSHLSWEATPGCVYWEDCRVSSH